MKIYIALGKMRSPSIPSILEIWANAAALTRVILGATSRVRVRGLDEHGTDVASSGDTIDSAGIRDANVILLKAQSINGL